MVSKCAKLSGFIGGGIVLIVGIVLFAVSFDTLTPHEIGLDFNTITQYVDVETKDNGRYFLGLGHEFLTFPKRLQYIEFSNTPVGGVNNRPLSIWSSDGQELLLEVGFYHKIIPERLSELYFNYEFSYVPVIEHVAANTFREVATKYVTTAFFENRTAIQDEMATALQNNVKNHMPINIERFNLLAIEVPDRFEDAVIAKIVKSQEERIARNEQTVALIRKETELFESLIRKNITALYASATRQATILTGEAHAKAFNLYGSTVGQLYADFAEALGFVENDDSVDVPRVLQLLYISLIRGRGRKIPEITVGYPTAVLGISGQ